MTSTNWPTERLRLALAALLLLLAGCSSLGSSPQQQARVEEATQAFWWLCDGQDAMETRLLDATLWLQLPGSQDWLLLPQARAASGALYSNAQGTSFWNRGDRARIATPQKTWADCQLIHVGPPGSTPTYIPGTNHSPDALILKASGQNPSWQLEVRQRGDALLTQHFGTRQMNFSNIRQVQQNPLERRYEMQDAQGNMANLQVENLLCIELGSGEPFPHRVLVEYLNQEYRGCGQSF